MKSVPPRTRLAVTRWLKGTLLALLLSLPATSYAAFLSGDALDTAADVMAWVVLIVAPIVGIGVFLLVHILPEKIAEKKQHPQAKAIQVLCLLSLAFGGLLWPMAWLWAYTKPVLHKMAYGTDRVPHDHEEESAPPSSDNDAAAELKLLRERLAALETRLAGKSAAETAKA
jgi:CBS domain containing-hemolysin-like protein